MKTQKKAISLIVLVVTVIVLGILAGVVIVNISNTNIIEQANIAKFKNDMATYKEAYNLYLASKYAEDPYFNASSITEEDYEDIFGEGYSGKMKVIDGKLVYLTTDTNEQAVLDSMGIINKAETTQTLALGTKISYTPDANPTGSYNGATNEFKEDNSVSTTYTDPVTYETKKGYIVEKTKQYTPGTHEWVYMGQDELGRTLLTTTTVGPQMVMSGIPGWKNGADRLDTLCNTLYGSSTYGSARSFNIDDYQRLGDYTGTGYGYSNYVMNQDYSYTSTCISTQEPITIGRADELLKYNRGDYTTAFVPDNDKTLDEYYLTDACYDTAFTSKKNTAFKALFKDAEYTYFWLANPAVIAANAVSYAQFGMYRVSEKGNLSTLEYIFTYSGGGNESNTPFMAGNTYIRPVVVLDADVQIVKMGDTYSLIKI
ncbi:MAG: hypothetical protein IKV94_00605 [Clostridia bacterium]|nr:hypothetical protein [Clostridia bacterium]